MSLHLKIASVLLLAGCGVAGCVSPQGRLQSDFSASLRQNLTAQIADPDARYQRTEPPAASGARSALAQEHYNTGKVIPPLTTGASQIGVAGGAAPPTGK